MLDWMLRRARGLGSNGLAIACALALSSAASAATLQVSGGQLFGASGVLVDGQLYDVAFIDGSCVAVFGGCDEVSDFVIQTETLAELAGQALLDQVLLDVPGLGLFDTDTELTHGITANNSGRIQTPFGFSEAGSLMVWTSWNRPTFDNHHINFTSPTLDYGYDDDLTYAVWTPVPEPGTGVLMGMGLLGMGWHRRRTR